MSTPIPAISALHDAVDERRADVLIFDDDAYLAGMFSAVFEDLGFTTQRFYSGYGALEAVRRHAPRMVVADIMMPGMDGLSLCRKVKSGPNAGEIKVVVVSGKPFAEEKAEAERCGADAFYAKPFDPVRFRRGVTELLGRAAPDAGRAAPRPGDFQIRIWGAGGEQGFCLSADLGDALLIFDAGRGAQELAASLKTLTKKTWVLLSRQDPQHLAGLSALCALPCSGPGSLTIGSPQHPLQSLTDAVQHALHARRPAPELLRVPESVFSLGSDAIVTAMFARHPGAALAFRVEHKRRALVYAPLDELETDEEIRSDFDEKMGRLARGADLLVHDARYVDEDYPPRRGRGHSCPRQAMELALREGVRRLALFGLDPGYGEARMAAELDAARRTVRNSGYSFRVDLARPGISIDV